ncbi:MAG: hypothetical protein ACKVH8_10215 [Pirellulales bacterium]
MAISQNQLDQFHQFATELISEREVGFSLPELFDLWRIKNPATEEQVDVKKIIRQGEADVQSENYRSLDAFMNDFRDKYQVPSS